MFLLNRKIKLNSTIVLNLISTFILQGVHFLTVPIFTRLLGAEQYGYASIYFTWITIITNFIGFGVGTSIASGQYHMKNEYIDFRNATILLNAIVCAIVIAIMIFFLKPINSFLSYTPYIYVTLLLSSMSHSIIASIHSAFVYEKKALMNFVMSIVLAFGTVIISLYFIYNVSFDQLYYARVFGDAIPYVVLSISMIIYILLRYKIIIKKKYVIYAFSYGFPIVFHTLAHSILGQSDRVMMEKMNILISDIGIYSLYYAFANVVQIILGAFNTSFAPFYLDDIDNNDVEGQIKKSKNYIQIFTIICIGFILLSREVAYILSDSSFYKGIEMIPIFVASAYFIFMYQFAVNFEFYLKKTKTIAAGTIGAALLNIVLNVIFISKWGMYGAAMSTLISYIMLYIFHYVIVLHIKDKQFAVRVNLFIRPLLFILLSTVMFYVLKDYFIVRWAIGAIIGIYELICIIKRKRIF